ncbi:MAG TPA: MBL fold metallo-hydrolase [Roseiflexaceae bacterium]|nr:MBL fold metallo-hydrolase [Roseiflexaceae bacterium]
MTIAITHIGTATMLLEIGELRLLTDPVFDPPGGRYRFGWGTGSVKLSAPAIAAESLGAIDAVLLSHDHHEDNLDRAGRALLPRAGRVLTTVPGARRLRGRAEGLRPWQSTWLEAGATRVKVTATPAQHGALITRPLAGATIGFVLEWEGQRDGALYITGDTIYYRGIDQVAQRFRIGVGIFHVGRASFPITGPLRYTMDSRDAVRAARALRLQTVIPIHYEGWKHFAEGQTAIDRAFTTAGLPAQLRWLPLGQRTTVEV